MIFDLCSNWICYLKLASIMFIICRVVAGGRTLLHDSIKEFDGGEALEPFFLSYFYDSN